MYVETLKSDYVDIQGGTTKEGIHTVVMAGAAVLALRAYAGLNLDGPRVGIDPCLPAAWREVRFNIGFKGDRYYFVVTPEHSSVKVDIAILSQFSSYAVPGGNSRDTRIQRDWR